MIIFEHLLQLLHLGFFGTSLTLCGEMILYDSFWLGLNGVCDPFLKVVCNNIKPNNLSLNESNTLWQQINLSKLEFLSHFLYNPKTYFLLSWFENKVIP
jgi:hypothetical protein